MEYNLQTVLGWRKKYENGYVEWCKANNLDRDDDVNRMEYDFNVAPIGTNREQLFQLGVIGFDGVTDANLDDVILCMAFLGTQCVFASMRGKPAGSKLRKANRAVAVSVLNKAIDDLIPITTGYFAFERLEINDIPTKKEKKNVV